MAKHTTPTSTKSPAVKPTRSPLPRQRRRRAERAPLIPFAQSDASELDVDVAFGPETPPAVQNPRLARAAEATRLQAAALAEDEIPFSSQPAPVNDPAEPKIRPEILPYLCGLVLVALHQVGKTGIGMADLMKMMLSEAMGALTADEVAVGVLRAVEIKAAVKVDERYFAWGKHVSLAPVAGPISAEQWAEVAEYHAAEAAKLRAEADVIAKGDAGMEPAPSYRARRAAQSAELADMFAGHTEIAHRKPLAEASLPSLLFYALGCFVTTTPLKELLEDMGSELEDLAESLCNLPREGNRLSALAQRAKVAAELYARERGGDR